MEPEVLIVGAGPTGLTTAVELARRGVKTTIVEQRPGVSSLSRAVGITPASLKLLSPSGATQKLLQQSVKIDSVRVVVRGRPGLFVPFSQSGIDSKYKYILALSQENTEQILTHLLEKLGVYVRYNTRLRSLNDTRDGVITVCSDGTAKPYRYVVGADGVDSTTRESIRLTFDGHDLEDPWSIADVEVSNWPHAKTFSLLLGESGSMAAVVPLGEHRLRVITNTANALEFIGNELSVSRIYHEGQFNISVRQVNTYQRGNIFLAGDAAHCHSPVGGRGMNLGIADAVCLANCIVNNNTQSYSASRHPEGWRTINNSERARKLISVKHPLARGVLESSLRLVARSPLLQRRMIDQLLYA